MSPNPPNHTVRVAWFLACLVVAPGVVHATQTAITGTVTDSLSGLAISGARVGIRRSGADSILRVETSARGRFRLTVPPGEYRIDVEAIGHRATTFEFTLVEGTASLHVALARLPLQLAPVEVVSRTTEQLLSAPGAVSLLTGATLEERNTMVASDYLQSAAGIDIANKGLAQATFSTRGPSSGNSAALLVLRDYRLASLPSLRLNVPYFIPGTADDLERIEVARGPSSAVYGADADRGVVHFISRSPFASRGASVDLSVGERSVRKAEARIAATLGEKVGFKISGEYLRGVDWEFHDPNEVLPRDSLVERAGGEARLDWRPDDETTLVFSGGLTSAIRNVDLTPVSTVQVRDWRYWFGQFRLTHDRLAFNTFYNASDAGESVLLYSGQPLVDQSRLWSAQVQHGLQLSPGFDVIYGADVQVVEPRTGGTYHGRYEADDDITQIGGFVNGTIALAPRWTLVAAARLDHHSRLDDLAVSPRVGVVFEPGPNHALRLTINRATSTPTATDLFLDIHGGDLGPLPFEVRARGAITPYTFRRDCAGGVCMRSPFTGDATAFLPMDATLAWSGLVAILQSQGVDISSIPRPGPSDVASVLGRLNLETQAFDPVGVADVVDIPAAARRLNSTLETGYRGVPAPGIMVSVDLYWSHLTNAASVREVQTPNVFLDQATLTGYLGRFMPAQQAAAIAGAAAGIPLGTISPEQGDSTELLSLTREGSSATFWGADFTATADLSRSVSINGTYSWTSKDVIPSTGGFGDIVMNAPQHKGSLGLRYTRSRVTADLRGRAVSGFPVQSGVQVGRVEAYVIVDSGVSCVLFRNPALTLSLTASNLLDNRHQEFVGAPAIGRLVLVRLRAAL